MQASKQENKNKIGNFKKEDNGSTNINSNNSNNSGSSSNNNHTTTTKTTTKHMLTMKEVKDPGKKQHIFESLSHLSKTNRIKEKSRENIIISKGNK